VVWGILAALVLIVSGTAVWLSAVGGQRAAAWSYGILGVIISVLLVMVGMVKSVGPTEVGVPVSVGQVGEPLDPGLHMAALWTTVETYPTRPVVVELSGDSRVQARTADAGQVNVEVAARWMVDPARAKDLYMQVRTGDDEAISQDLVVKNLRQAVGSVYSRMGSLVALNDRAKVTQEVRQALAEQLSPYGIVVEDVNLRSVEPDEKTAAVVARRANQQQETQIAIEAKKTAEIEAQRREIEARGLKRASAALRGLTPAEAALLCQQTWERAVAKTTDAGLALYTSPCGGSGGVIVSPGGAR
jgi:regulator of protease activity HflC (stomatin/prohibitin superfamily)